MNYVVRNLILCVLVLGACLLSIFPVEKNLRLGKDLAGGVSLTYTVDVKPDDPSDVVDRTIAVLKDRVNPDGLFEISMVQQGRDRIEISMPLPNAAVRKLRADYEAALDTFHAFEIDSDAFLRVMRLQGAERVAALRGMADTVQRSARLEPVIKAAETVDAARAAYEAAKAAGKPEADLAPLLDAAGDAEATLEIAQEEVLDSLTSAERLRAAMDLSAKQHKLVDRKAKDPAEREITIPSPRERALAEIREKIKGLPQAEETINKVVEAHKAYAATRIGFDDPNDLIRLLQGAGVLDFRIGVMAGTIPDEERLRREIRERGPENTRPEGMGWFRLNSIDNWYDKPSDLRMLRDNAAAYFTMMRGAIVEEYGGEYYMLLHDVPQRRLTKADGNWNLVSASPSMDELGRQSVAFRMDPVGADLMGRMTESNIQQPMAMVLDDQVYSTATIQSRISSNGQISGSFDPAEINYLIKTLNAGSLRAKLSAQPISQSTLAPELGLDNLQKGLDAAWIALIAIGVFMCLYYFTSGAIAMIAIAANAIIILGIMSLQQAAFTLPGIAGVVLTFGTAVDANVLIYERIREELRGGADARQAVRTAFKRVGSTIIDANITNLIVCVVLVLTGTQEIRGFGITLGIGVVATLFCAMIVTRVIFVLLLDHVKAGPWVVGQLPLVFPWIQKVMTPRVNWMRLFPVFVVTSTIFVGMGIFFVLYEGNKLLDSEFRGGTSITLQLKEESGQRTTLKRGEVEERVKGIAKDAGEASAIVELRNAEIVPINPRNDGVTSDRFTIRTTLTDERSLREAIVGAFGDVVESNQALGFSGSDVADVTGAPVFAIVNPQLGQDIGMPDVTNDVSAYLGGVAIVLKDISPAVSKSEMAARLEHMRVDAKYSTDALKREHSLIVLEGTDQEVKTAVIVVHDPRHSVFEDEAKWRTELAGQEWEMTREALTIPTILASVNTFEPAIARTFRAQAIVAVILSFVLISVYVWVRFGSVRYSLAAVVPLVHDTLVAIGLVALAEIIYENFPGLAATLQIRPIKIDLGMVAAIMTIIGYSLNDTIVILDRIRENRGKLAYATKEVINESINQTMSRTFITAGTALVSLLVLYIYGGDGISSFAYTMICGMVVGTYSTIAIAAPIVYQPHSPAAPGLSNTDDRRDHSLPAGAGIG